MENSTDSHSKSSRDNSIRDSDSHSGLVLSTKSLDKCGTSVNLKLEKNSIHFKSEQDGDNQKGQIDSSVKVPHKIIANWKHACDKTKDKTKDLLKRWRTLPEIETEPLKVSQNHIDKEKPSSDSGWSVHIWTTWVDRFSIDSQELAEKKISHPLTPMQSNKFSHFFTFLLDHDHDDLISEQDFETLIEVFN
ncbi:hypothetical protein WA026_004311 [Henosepilachna vigintioctopunctata]|uniref:EF-hand domain-containing protein n=1 Tax=Henosepilachna vigintioctopunctata TaxID=420089 RepID=A0AAW1VAG3_9CUCU